MIGGDHRLRQRRTRVLEPLDVYAVEDSENQSQEGLRHRAPQDPRRHERNGDGQQSAQREQFAHRQPLCQQTSGSNRGDRHGERIDDVVGRNHARAMRRLAFVLQDRVERHGEEAARHRDADQVDENAPASLRAQEGRHSRQFRE